MKRSWLIPIFALVAAFNTQAAQISDADATNAIVGEAAAQPYIVKLGIAEALRNRCNVFKHPLRGVYGFNAAHNAGESKRVWKDARLAWTTATSAPKSSIVGGAIHFGNRSDVDKGTFAGMKLTRVLGAGKDATYFFKP